MRSFFFLIAFSFTGLLVKAQHNHFIYLQTDNKQPFYVKLRETIYSSSNAGYLIIPKLQPGTYNLSVGFPKNEFAAQNIPVTISGKDLGYLLKNFEGKGWGLFNMQTMDVIMATTTGAASAPVAKADTRTDDFSNMLADVVNTPSIKEVRKEEPKEEKKPVPVKKEEPAAVIPVSAAPQTSGAAPKIEVAAKPAAIIKKISSSQTGEGANLVYLLTDEYGSDTVNVIIPIEKAPATADKPVIETAKKAETKKKETGKQPGDPKFIEIDLPNAPQEKPVVKEESSPKPIGSNSPQPANAGLTMINSDCKSVAADDDFIKTRKKMTAQKSDDEMISAAKKLFRQKCYSTAQVKNLSVLFLKDESKYKFFDAIYPFVYDSREFKQLESQLSDEYYISRFRSMIRN